MHRLDAIGRYVVSDPIRKIARSGVNLTVEASRWHRAKLGKGLFAVLSVGGFLGMGERLVAVPFASLQIAGNKVMLPGGTKDALTALPEFKYATK